MDTAGKLHLIADELCRIANLELHSVPTHYDLDRFRRIGSLSDRLVAAIEGRTTADTTPEGWQPVEHAAPFVANEAAVFRNGCILLIKREDNGLWAMPGGATEVGETWAESAERELREETGVQGSARELLGVFDSRLCGSRVRQQWYVGVWLVAPGEGQIPIAGPETTGVGFFAADSLPDLSPGHKHRVLTVLKLVRGDLPVPYFDPSSGSNGVPAGR